MRSSTLTSAWPIEIVGFASSVYWSDESALTRAFQELETRLTKALPAYAETLVFRSVTSEEALQQVIAETPLEDGATIFVPFSGGVQPWMQALAAQRKNLALLHAYLPNMVSPEFEHAVMHRNAHPASTDFYASCRLEQKACAWLDQQEELVAFVQGFQAAQRLRHAKILKIGETEPWVINSCRDPKRFAEKWGVQVVPLERDAVYSQLDQVAPERVAALTADWLGGAGKLLEIVPADVEKACQVVAAMERLLEMHEADALSMACFAMIGDIDTTSCLALSSLNDSANAIGACEGDLDAAATLFLLRALGADFVWIGNPIIHPGSMLEMAHCTAPRCACGQKLSYKLMRHHESGRGVAPEVQLPADEAVTLARIGDNLNQLVVHPGTTRRIEKMPTCHTQIQVDVGDTSRVVDSLLGTHLVMSYGDWQPALKHAAKFLQLAITPGAN